MALSPETIASGLALLGTTFNRDITPELAHVYQGVLGEKLTEAQWKNAVKRALEAEKFFPVPAVLLKYGLSDVPLSSLAGHAYTNLVEAFERGEKIGYRDVLFRHGKATAEAFIAAGGTGAFAWCEPDAEPYRRRDFFRAFVEQIENDPALLLLGAEGLALGDGE